MEPMAAQTAHKYEYDTQYHKEAMTRFCVRWHNVSDADIIQKLDSVPNKADYVRQLIRQDIEREEEEKTGD